MQHGTRGLRYWNFIAIRVSWKNFVRYYYVCYTHGLVLLKRLYHLLPSHEMPIQAIVWHLLRGNISFVDRWKLVVALGRRGGTQSVPQILIPKQLKPWFEKYTPIFRHRKPRGISATISFIHSLSGNLSWTSSRPSICGIYSIHLRRCKLSTLY